MKKKKKILKIFALSSLVIALSLSLAAAGYYFAVTMFVHLDESKFSKAYQANYSVVDTNKNKINNLSDATNQYVLYDTLHPYTIDAFVLIEDKRFFSHKGVDFVRIFGAIKNNIFHPNSKQGGSTISQQVIKNTQLSNEKTISRKLKEIKLAIELEKKYSKKEIMEIYLNSIYFGNGCYGINKASRYYFDKSPSELTIAESALLASTINAPSIYDPVHKSEKANQRKNLVLSLMKKSAKIDDTEYKNAVNEPIKTIKSKNNYDNSYFKATINEACKVLQVSENQLANMNLTIHSYYDPELQQALNNSVKDIDKKNLKVASIILDNEKKGIAGLVSSGGVDICSQRRQPGSVIKPIIVYAPAFECGKYSPSTLVCDEPISISGYSPENANKKFLGEVSVKTALEKSLNVPAVKILDNIGISYAKQYANKFGIDFSAKDNNLALALGGFTDGLTLKQLGDAYMCFANEGNFEQSAFIDKIEQNGKVIYNRNYAPRQAASKQTAYLVNDCLKAVAKSGTAKRLDCNFAVCSKTGTVGSVKGNSDAYNIAYTPDYTIATWFGAEGTDLMSSSVSGATYPTFVNRDVLKNIKIDTTKDFSQPEGIVKIKNNELDQNKDSGFNLFIEKFAPKKVLDNNQFIIEIDNFENSKPIIKFFANRAKSYKICRKNGLNLTILAEISNKNERFSYVDYSANKNCYYEYFVVEQDDFSSVESNHIKLFSH